MKQDKWVEKKISKQVHIKMFKLACFCECPACQQYIIDRGNDDYVCKQ